ncbi:uncharacterized protein LOC121431461 [Lytechinus variegatus]|uniref:uncharacterized protein LOC121431461 n=1 Tax=Lytechinus variegatus TaxID=7654 RepID=UPI001BB2AA62|nr:uncharacterized protein LOC121431461 [Lytechinus variegatus]
MELLNWRIFVFVVGFFTLSAASEPDWSCDFTADDCGIIQLQGNWTVVLSNGNEMIDVDVSSSMRDDVFAFSIPYNFTSQVGNISFDYLIAGVETVFRVMACRGRSEAVREIQITGSEPLMGSMLIPYSCASVQDVQIIFNATQRDVPPLIRLDNIEIYELIYTEIPTTPPPLTTTTTTVIVTMESTTTGTIETPVDETVTVPTGETTSADDDSWLIPVVATISALLVIIVIVLIVAFVYRKRKPKKSEKSQPDIQYYADLRANPETGKFEAGAPSASAADAFKVQNGKVSADFVGNPVYQSGNVTPREDEGANESLIGSPLYESSIHENNDSRDTLPADQVQNDAVHYQQIRGNALYAAVNK